MCKKEISGEWLKALFVPRLKDCCMLSDAFRLLEFPPEVYNFKYWHEIVG